MEEVLEEWNARIHKWMIQNKQVSVAGLAHIRDGAVFAAACITGDPVEQIYRGPYQVSLPQENGTDLLTNIDEAEILKIAAESLRAPNGIWIAGQKYKIVRTESSCDQGKFSFKTLFCVKSKGGCYIIVTPGGLIILALYSEDLGQQSMNAKNAALAFGEYLANHGY